MRSMEREGRQCLFSTPFAPHAVERVAATRRCKATRSSVLMLPRAEEVVRTGLRERDRSGYPDSHGHGRLGEAGGGYAEAATGVARRWGYELREGCPEFLSTDLSDCVTGRVMVIDGEHATEPGLEHALLPSVVRAESCLSYTVAGYLSRRSRAAGRMIRFIFFGLFVGAMKLG